MMSESVKDNTVGCLGMMILGALIMILVTLGTISQTLQKDGVRVIIEKPASEKTDSKTP